MTPGDPYPPLDAYAYIGDGHTSALVATSGSIDWCCMPRMDSPSCFGRLLDWSRGGHFTLAPEGDGWTVHRRYLPDTLVLETTFEGGGGTVRLLECVAMRIGGRLHPYRQILRVVEGVEGEVRMVLHAVPRLEYGALRPWIRRHGEEVASAVAGRTGLLFSGDIPLSIDGTRLEAAFAVGPGERRRLAMQFQLPHVFEGEPFEVVGGDEIDFRLEETIEWWRTWTRHLDPADDLEPARHSARVLKAMIDPPTGAMVAAPTTSLPETLGGERNWDYRYVWIRDSVFSVRALTALGAFREADGFRRFVQRTSAGDADAIQIVYGVDGRIRLPEYTIDLEGYCRSRPVRVGNAAFEQVQLDTYGYLLELAWEWFQRAEEPDPAYWSSILEVVEVIRRRWQEPDYGIWEIRRAPRHHVHSKVLCWAGLDHALRLAVETGFDVPVDEWTETRDAIRSQVMEEGVRDGSFVQAFGEDHVDAALLMLPLVDFVPADDPRMLRTTDRIMEELSIGGSRLILRYRSDDGLSGDEGAFIACCFWLAEVLALQGRRGEAWAVFEEAVATGGDLGLFSEEYDPVGGVMLGNYPQALSHLAHIEALLTLRNSGV